MVEPKWLNDSVQIVLVLVMLMLRLPVLVLVLVLVMMLLPLFNMIISLSFRGRPVVGSTMSFFINLLGVRINRAWGLQVFSAL